MKVNIEKDTQEFLLVVGLIIATIVLIISFVGAAIEQSHEHQDYLRLLKKEQDEIRRLYDR